MVAEDGRLVCEVTRWDRIAACLREEDGDVVLSDIGVELRVARNFVRRCRSAPLVSVEGVEINRLGAVSAASKVVLQHWPKRGDIRGRVADGNVAVFLRVAIGLDVSDRRFDVWRRHGAVAHGQDFVADKNTCQVIVLLEFIQDFLESRELGLIPVRRKLVPQLTAICFQKFFELRTYLVDGRIERVQIDEQVYPGITKCLHATTMVSSRIYVVDTDGVRAEGLHELSIECALLGIDKWVV